MRVLNFGEWVQVQESEDITFYDVVTNVTEAVEQGYDVDTIANYLYENFGIELDTYRFVADIERAIYEEENGEAPKQSMGQKVGGHFKKHWKKYAAAGAVGAGAGAYALGRGGKLGAGVKGGIDKFEKGAGNLVYQAKGKFNKLRAKKGATLEPEQHGPVQ